MRVQLGSALIIAAAGAGMFSGTAFAQNVDWATCSTSAPACSSTVTSCCNETASNLNFGQASGDKAIIIPLDRCHQRIESTGTMDEPGIAAPRWCADPPAANAEGMFHAYGLVYRLMQMGVPVYWIVNPTKHASGPANYGSLSDQVYYEDDIDMWILHSSQTASDIPTGSGSLTACTTAGSCTGPVSLLADNLSVASTYQYKEFPLRGSAFVIAGKDTDGDNISDRVEFNSFWNSYGNASASKTCAPSQDCYDFTSVNLYEVNTTAIAAWTQWGGSGKLAGLPVAVKLNYKPPRIARVKSGGNVSSLFLQAANLDDPASTSCKQGIFTRSSGTLPYDPVVCDLDETDLLNNSLVTGNFGWAWFDGGAPFSSCSRALQAIRTFVIGVPGVYKPGNAMVNDSRLREFEECANHQLLGRYGAAFSSGTGALDLNNAVNEDQDQPWLIRYPTNLFAQYGDIPMDFASSSTGSWQSGNMSSSTSWGYNMIFAGTSTLKRLLTREAARTATTNEICGDENTDGDLAAGAGTPDSGDLPHYRDLYPHNSVSGCDASGDNDDVAAYARFNNDALNGIVFYLPGNNLSNNNVRGELRMLLNSLIATPTGEFTATSPTQLEVSRSSPIVPLVNGVEYIVQGTHLTTDPGSTAPEVSSDDPVALANFYFPFRVGHMRMQETDGTLLFDVGCNMSISSKWTGFTACASTPSPNAGIAQTGRRVFTNTQGGDLRSGSDAYMVDFDTNLSAAMKGLIALGTSMNTTVAPTTGVNTVIDRVVKGYPDGTGGYFAALGGVDRSTVAVIQESDVAPDGISRPMMVYFGAADGMMHAVCAESASWVDSTGTTRACNAGKELWAFLPRKMLPHLRTNTARIDGSPRVLDAYIDPDGTGGSTAEWRTILVFQTGMGDYTLAGREPAVYALDITDPWNPHLMWEYTDSAAGTFSLGVGLTMSAGPTTIGGVTKYLAWAQTTNLGTSGPGSVITAINLETGAKHRQVLFQFSPNPRDATNHDPVVRSAIPQGTVPLDLPSGSSGKITDIMFNDVWGRTWVVNPDTLVSVNGATTPLFQQLTTASGDYYAMGAKPAVLESGGAQYAVFGTGGYSDPTNTTWPIACCASASGSACDSPQPAKRQVCSQYNNSAVVFPTQMFVAVKIDKTATSTLTVPSSECDSFTTDPTLPDCATGFLFKRNLGRDERATSQALVVGTDIFLTTDSDNANRSGYGNTGASTGALYMFNAGTGVQAAKTTVVLGAGGAAASNTADSVTNVRSVFAGAGTSFGTGGTTTSGNNVTKKSASGVSRKVWLRTE